MSKEENGILSLTLIKEMFLYMCVTKLVSTLSLTLCPLLMYGNWKTKKPPSTVLQVRTRSTIKKLTSKTQATAWNVTIDLIRRIEIKLHHLNLLESQVDRTWRGIYILMTNISDSTGKDIPVLLRWGHYSKVEILYK